MWNRNPQVQHKLDCNQERNLLYHFEQLSHWKLQKNQIIETLFNYESQPNRRIKKQAFISEHFK